MCGIAGVLRGDGTPDTDLLVAMADAIRHRGPDDGGVHVSGPCGLANRRLAIVDRSDRGHQPMLDDATGAALTYNGEVYGHDRLRAELEAAGRAFASDTDTEVVLHGYLEWGTDVFRRLDGMFALALWDPRAGPAGRLVLARDRFGVKPLYLHHDGTVLRFGSEVKALLADPAVPRLMNPHALRSYLTFQNQFDDRTLFDGVRMLPPATFAVWEPGQGGVREVERVRYWRPAPRPTDPAGAPGPDEVRAAFEAAVLRQLRADVRVGSLLSAGMDSGSIAAVAAEAGHLDTAVTGSFDTAGVEGREAGFDEGPEAAALAVHLGVPHRLVPLTDERLPERLDELVWHLEDPRVGMVWQDDAVLEAAARDATVWLSGAGGDELFGGYPWRYRAASDRAASLAYWQRLVPETDHAGFFTDAVLEATPDWSAEDLHRRIWDDSPDADALGRELDLELATFLHGLLVVTDKVAAAHSLEVRVPFLDNGLVELSRRIPARHHMAAAEARFGAEAGGKRVLRTAMHGLLPDAIVERPKQGFSPPDGHWYRTTQSGWVESRLLDSPIHAYVRRDAVERVLREHAGGADHRLLLWSLLCLDAWCRRFLTPDGGHAL